MADSLHTRILRIVQRHWEANQPLEWGVCTAYSAATHQAKVRIQPDGRLTGYLPISSAPGVRLAVPPGTLCKVALDRGVPTSIVETHYQNGAAPSAGLALGDEAHFSGPVTAYSTFTLTPSRIAGHPTAGAHNQGELSMDVNGAMWACTVSGTPGTWKQFTLT